MKRAKAIPLPPSLREELASAYAWLRGRDRRELRALIAQHRRNTARRIAAWGISSIGAPVIGTTPIPPDVDSALWRLKDAREKRKRFRGGDLAHFMSSAMSDAIRSNEQRHRASRPGNAERNARIVELAAGGRSQKAIAREIDVSPKTVGRVLKKAGSKKRT